jgi:hypothetical protein
MRTILPNNFDWGALYKKLYIALMIDKIHFLDMCGRFFQTFFDWGDLVGKAVHSPLDRWRSIVLAHDSLAFKK